MYEKNSNITSIVIAVIAILLILGGVFLLNRSFNSGSNLAQSSANSVSKSSSSKNSKSSLSSSSSSVANTKDTQSENSSSQSVKSSSSKMSIDLADMEEDENNFDKDEGEKTNKQTSSTAKTSSKSSSASKDNKYNLEQNQILAKAIIPDAKGNNFEIIACGIKNPSYCKAGRRIRMEGSNYQAGQEYLLTGNIQDSGDSISLSNTIIRPYKAASSSSKTSSSKMTN